MNNRRLTTTIMKWYSAYDAKTGALVASGVLEEIADALGYSSVKCFQSAMSHSKYEFSSELISSKEYYEMLWAYRRRKAQNLKDFWRRN